MKKFVMNRKLEMGFGVFVALGALIGVINLVVMFAVSAFSWNTASWNAFLLLSCGLGTWQLLFLKTHSKEDD